MTANIGDEFQKNTKHSRERLIGGRLDWENKPETYKEYPNAVEIKLSKNLPSPTLPFAETLTKRKSIRTFSPKQLTIEEISFLLWASTGIQRIERDYEFRANPSAGALYPIETYLIANNVETLKKGIYHYNIPKHVLETLKVGNFADKIASSALSQLMCIDAPLVLAWTGVFGRSKWKYGQRAYRYVYLEAGHIAQTLALSATSIRLGSCQIGAFFDDEINRVLEIDGVDESVLYLSVVGHNR